MQLTTLGLVLAPVLAPNGGSLASTSGDDWASLDSELGSLASRLRADHHPAVDLFALIQASYNNSSDDLFFPGDGGSLQGFRLRRARLGVRGRADAYSYEISFEASDEMVEPVLTTGVATGMNLVDAFVDFQLTDALDLRVGRYRQPFLYSGLVNEGGLLFFDKTLNGVQNDGRDVGVMISGGPSEYFDLYVSAQNGGDGLADDVLVVGRAEIHFLGNAFTPNEGAYDLSGEDYTRLSLGLSAADDASLQEGLRWAAEAKLNQGNFSAHSDIVFYDEEYDAADPDVLTGGSKADTAPWSATLSYLLPGAEWEIAGRFEDHDDALETERFAVGVNWYPHGHNVKWILNYVDWDSEGNNLDGRRVEAGILIDV